MTKIDAFAHILRPACAERIDAITSAGAVSGRILGYGPLNLIIFADTIADIPRSACLMPTRLRSSRATPAPC